jgi:hypothetical protein
MKMNIPSHKSAALMARPFTLAVIALCVGVPTWTGCLLLDFNTPTPGHIQDRIDRDCVAFFADEDGRVRATMQCRTGGSINDGIRCLEDNSVWKPDLGRTLDLAKGYASTRPVKAITTLPQDWYNASPASRPVDEGLSAAVLVDERGRVRAVARTTGDLPIDICPIDAVGAWRLDIMRSWGEAYRAATSGWFFTDDSDKDRAVIRIPDPNVEPNLVVECLDDGTVWRPDFAKSADLARGYVSTAPVPVPPAVSVAGPSAATRPAIERVPLVLRDERGRVRGVLMFQKGSERGYEIHPAGSSSVWRLARE